MLCFLGVAVFIGTFAYLCAKALFTKTDEDTKGLSNG